MALASNALTDYATVKARLRLTSDSDQTLIEALIGEASALIEKELGRPVVYASGITELVPMYGNGTDLLLARRPLVSVQEVAFDSGDSPLDADEWSIRDANVGSLWRVAGWPWTAYLRPGLNFTRDQWPGTEEKSTQVKYAAGYITGPQAVGASAWPGAAASVECGLLCGPASRATQLWRGTATDPTVAAVTGGSEPSWPASPSVGATLADNTVTWTYLGTKGSAGARGTAVTLPADLEKAAILATVYAYKTDDNDLSIKSETVGRASYTYDRSKGLPPAVLALLAPYRGGY